MTRREADMVSLTEYLQQASSLGCAPAPHLDKLWIAVNCMNAADVEAAFAHMSDQEIADALGRVKVWVENAPDLDVYQALFCDPDRWEGDDPPSYA